MIPGDIAAELAVAVRAAITAGELPAGAASVLAAGTWHPVPKRAGGGPGSYGTSLPFLLAELAGREPASVAAVLAGHVPAAPWIASVAGTGDGYLTVSVTASHLAGLAARIRAAGPAVARTDVLAGANLTAPALADLAAHANWRAAWRSQHDAVLGRIRRAAGATVQTLDIERKARYQSALTAGLGDVPVAVAYHGADAVRYALTRIASADSRAITRSLCVPVDITNPFVRVSYAHAEAASTRRWAAELWPLGRPPGQAPGGPASSRWPGPAELRLLDVLSWLPERVGAAARRRRAAELPRYLEQLAGTWLDCKEACPALPFGGARASADPAVTQARIGLADAVRITLAAGLSLLGVAAPDRI